ncbi:MAG: hypothetical protein ACRCX2_09955 [Paraclostridium sp.]
MKNNYCELCNKELENVDIDICVVCENKYLEDIVFIDRYEGQIVADILNEGHFIAL